MAGRGSEPRWFFGILVPEAIQALISSRAEDRLGAQVFRAARFAPGNWHQSASGLCESAEWVERYLAAGRKVAASGFVMRLDRLESRAGKRQDWAICASEKPAGLAQLQLAIRKSLQTEGIADPCRNTAHVTLSYRAPFLFDGCAIEPIEWTIDRFMLLRGGGQPYRYEIVESWLLGPPIPERPPPQGSLF